MSAELAAQFKVIPTNICREILPQDALDKIENAGMDIQHVYKMVGETDRERAITEKCIQLARLETHLENITNSHRLGTLLATQTGENGTENHFFIIATATGTDQKIEKDLVSCFISAANTHFEDLGKPRLE